MSGDERVYALAVMSVAGIGARRANRLLDRFGTLEGAWHAPLGELRRQLNLDQQALEALEAARRSPETLARAQQELAAAEARGIAVYMRDAPDYPPLLREIADPPLALFVQGRLPLDAPMVAMVGTRRATAYGLRTARRLAEELAACGITVVSGLALGIDAAAHAGALDAGRTVAVLGSGLDHLGPASNRPLARRILEAGGGLVSEYRPGTPPAAGQFPARNRIVSGMARAVVVVEAPERSGALITADLALEQGREVMAVPGAIDQPQSAGALELLSQGAKLVTGVEDILSELPGFDLSPRTQRGTEGLPVSLPPEEARILAALESEPLHVDRIVAKTGLPTAVVTALLLVLELKAFIVQLPGNSYIRRS